jgi:hypothetical protein
MAGPHLIFHYTHIITSTSKCWRGGTPRPWAYSCGIIVCLVSFEGMTPGLLTGVLER